MTFASLTPLFAGAVFTPEEMNAIVVAVVLTLLVGLACMVLFVRSAVRLVTQKERSASDMAIVGLGLLLLAPRACSAAGASIRDAGLPAKEDRSIELVSEVTGRSETEFEPGRWNHFQACSFYKMDLVDADRSYRSDLALQENNATVREDAARFEAAGWTLTKYESDNPDDPDDGLAFRAERGDDALLLYEWGGLGYAYLDVDCPPFSGNLESGRRQVAEFPAG